MFYLSEAFMHIYNGVCNEKDRFTVGYEYQKNNWI